MADVVLYAVLTRLLVKARTWGTYSFVSYAFYLPGG